MVVRRVPVSSLTIDPSNARKHDQRNLDAIAGSLGKFGQVEPLVVQKGTGKVIGGNGRLEVMRARGETEVDINEVECTDEEATALGIALNRTAELATWNDETLARLLQELPADLQGIAGFDEDDLSELLTRLAPKTVDEDEVPEPLPDPVSRRGDLWIMGGHRLLCGDCTIAEDVKRSLNGRKADATLSDPPYGIGLGYAEHDDTAEALAELVAKFLPLAREHSKVVALTTGVSNHRLYPAPTWMMCWYYGVGPFRCPWGFHVWQPVLVYGPDPYLAAGLGCRPDALHAVGAPDRVPGHPCPKPVKVWAMFIERVTIKAGAVVFDPFFGSGTTAIACEQMGRVACGIEMTPQYVDLSVRRWQNFTGKAATLDGDGRTFDQVATERLASPASPPPDPTPHRRSNRAQASQ